jgi:hypothetical protein
LNGFIKCRKLDAHACCVIAPPLAQLSSDGTQMATYTGGNATSVLTFEYTVQELDQTLDLDYLSTAAFVLPPGTTLHRLAPEITAVCAVVGHLLRFISLFCMTTAKEVPCLVSSSSSQLEARALLAALAVIVD